VQSGPVQIKRLPRTRTLVGSDAGVSGNLTMKATIAPVLRNASNAPALLTNTGELEGTIVGVAMNEENLR